LAAPFHLGRRSRFHAFVFGAAAISWIAFPNPLFAQTGSVDSDARDARIDAILAMPNYSQSAPLSNLYSTAPGLEQQIPTTQWRFNIVAPFGYTSNAEEIATGGTQTFEYGPVGNFSFAGPLAGLPLRLTLSTFVDADRFARAPNAALASLGVIDLDRIGGNARLQYVDPDNDQSFSPYIAFAPRWSYQAGFSDLLEARQDLNIGFNKRFNFDGSFQPLAISGDTSAATVWSFGLTAFGQIRNREPQLSSHAVFLIPSVSYVISTDWTASLAVEFLGRWYEPTRTGFSGRDFEALPIATAEYTIPAAFFGSDEVATMLGRPALDFQTSYLKVWSTFPRVSFDKWDCAIAIRAGWRF
jgi:hypothetical protein